MFDDRFVSMRIKNSPWGNSLQGFVYHIWSNIVGKSRIPDRFSSKYSISKVAADCKGMLTLLL